MKLCLRCGFSFQGANWKCPSCGWMPQSVDGFIAFAPELAENNDYYETEHHGRLAALENGNFWFRARNELILWALDKFFPQAQTILEVGCGTGFVLKALEDSHPDVALVGTEIHVSGLEVARRRVTARTELVQLDAASLPFRDEFDVASVFDVIEHINDDEKVLGEIAKALKAGGGLLVSVPHHAFLWSEIDKVSRHVRRYSTSELIDKVRRGGFEIIFVTSFSSLLLPLMVFSRRICRRKADEELLFKQFLIPHWMNFLFEKTLGFERFLIKSGVTFPFGGSLFLVARKAGEIAESSAVKSEEVSASMPKAGSPSEFDAIRKLDQV